VVLHRSTFAVLTADDLDGETAVTPRRARSRILLAVDPAARVHHFREATTSGTPTEPTKYTGSFSSDTA
jgi:hypothetical protein